MAFSGDPQLLDDIVASTGHDYQVRPDAKGQRRPISHSLCGFHHLGGEQNSGPVHSRVFSHPVDFAEL